MEGGDPVLNVFYRELSRMKLVQLNMLSDLTLTERLPFSALQQLGAPSGSLPTRQKKYYIQVKTLAFGALHDRNKIVDDHEVDLRLADG